MMVGISTKDLDSIFTQAFLTRYMVMVEMIIFWGKGDDIIDGGDGNDVAIYQGARDGYSITDNGDGTYTISDSSGKDGTDRLSNIESLSFADQDLGLGQMK